MIFRMKRSIRATALGCLALAAALLGLTSSTAAAARQAPASQPPARQRFPAADHVFTADDFARTHEILCCDEKGREITYQIRVHPGLPVYRIRLIPDQTAAENDPSMDPHHVGRVEISLAGSPSVLQTIEVEGRRGGRAFIDQFDVQDINLDGYADLAFFRDGGGKWGSYTWWLFDPSSGHFVRNALSRDLDQLASNGVIPDRRAGTIMAPYLSATCAIPIYDLFKIVDGRLQLVERDEPRFSYETEGICAVAVSKLIDGKLQQVELKKAPVTRY
jgi:hypothetical protein